MNKKYVKTVVLALVIAVSLLAVPVINAHGNIDQSCYPPSNPMYYWEYSPVFARQLGQEFRPYKSNLIGVDLFLSNTGPSTDKYVTVRIYKGTLGANQQISTTQEVYIPSGYSWVHIDFETPIALTRGATYVINLSGSLYSIYWVANYPGTYSGGQAWVGTRQNSRLDFCFRTYYDPDLQPPVADAGPDQTIEQDCHGEVTVTLDGSGSSDANGDPLTYSWTWDGGSASGVTASGTFPLGTTYVTLVVNDGLFSDSDVVSITVEDTTPPEITVSSVTPAVLWPPNHKMIDVEVDASWSDLCDPYPAVAVTVSSNEPINEKGRGGGNTEPDWEIVDNTHFRLRAERDGSGSDRVYTITYVVTDASGNAATVSVTVTVPHDKSK